jgi:hypothetical protein
LTYVFSLKGILLSRIFVLGTEMKHNNLNSNKKNNSRVTAAIAATILTVAIIIMAAASSMMITAASVAATTSTNATTITPPPPVGQEEQEQQQTTIHITKHSTNSYTISGEMSSVGSFDTTYRIAGERSAIRSAENLIISTITDDFRNSPTIGYILAVNMTTGGAADTATANTLPNPFASPEQITERITSELRRVISEVESNTTTPLLQGQEQPQHVEIKCDFGMILDEMQCSHVPSVSVGAIEEVAEATNVNPQITD